MYSNTATLALFIWPLVVIALFRKRPRNEALAWSIIAGYLLLPEIAVFDLPLLPAWDKSLVPSMFAAIMCYILVLQTKTRVLIESRDPGAVRNLSKSSFETPEEYTVRRGRIMYWALVLLLFGSPAITAMNNAYPIFNGARTISGLRPYDFFSINLNLVVTLAPFFLARRFLTTHEDHVVLLKVLVLACLGYSFLALWEVRMSPMLNKQIYGFLPNKWGQHIRYGGFRPMLFLYHGIWVASVFALSTMAALVLWREKLTSKGAGKYMLLAIWLLFTLVLCKSVSALTIAVVLLLVILLFPVRLQLLTAAAIAAMVMIYPGLRGADYVPVDRIYSAFAAIDLDRAKSLNLRFKFEDELLAHANKKPLAGWGTYGRNRTYNKGGNKTAAADGYWVIVAGSYGWLGYIAQFGLLGLATVFLAFNRKRLNISAATAGLSVVLAGALIDLIPNATITPIVWLIAGALMGHYQTAKTTRKEANVRLARNLETKEAGPPGPEPAMASRAPPLEDPRPLHVRRPRES